MLPGVCDESTGGLNVVGPSRTQRPRASVVGSGATAKWWLFIWSRLMLESATALVPILGLA